MQGITLLVEPIRVNNWYVFVFDALVCTLFLVSLAKQLKSVAWLEWTGRRSLLLLFRRHTPRCFHPAPTHRYGLFGALLPCSPRFSPRLRPYFHYRMGSLSLLRLYCWKNKSIINRSSKPVIEI